jgi:hypothetical protein
MNPTISRAGLVFAFLLGGCATTSISDAEAIDPAAAYVVISARASIWDVENHLFDLTLACADATGASQTVYLPKLRREELTIVKVRPGTCHLAKVGIQYASARADLKPGATAFEARPGVLNYPGSWDLVFELGGPLNFGSITNPQAAQQYVVRPRVSSSPSMEQQVRSQFPRVLAKLPLTYMRVRSPA